MRIEDWLAALELIAIFSTATGGAFAAVKAARLDLLGVLTLGTITALGGGIMRDVLIGVTPPVAFTHLAYLGAAVLGSALPMFLGQPGKTLRRTIRVLDAVGLGLYSVVGADKALLHGLEPLPAVLVGAISGVGGGVIRDITVNRVPEVLRKGFYAIPAMAGAATVAVYRMVGLGTSIVPTLLGAVLCFALWAAGKYWRIEVARPKFKPKEPDVRASHEGPAEAPPSAGDPRPGG